ncbi:MAG: hypothetical protein U0872_03995 [Planctomycetaceae bacterium]
MRTVSCRVLCCALGWLALTATSSAGRIEAVRGKAYRLTKEHGPWMIMVTTFRDVDDDDDRKTAGLTAQEAADELVYELRKWGLPAYSYSQAAEKAEIETVDRQGRQDKRVYAAQRDMICVLAGNYETQEDSNAGRTLTKVKSFVPTFMQDKKSGAIVRQRFGKTKDKTPLGPFANAFLTINPLLDPKEVAARTPDTDLIKLNYGMKHSLAENPAKFTVQVATFYGRSMAPTTGDGLSAREKEFEMKLASSQESTPGVVQANLNLAGEDAMQLTHELRRKGFDAWVYHDRFTSIVTVGGFDSPQDPRVMELVKNFGAKVKKDPATGQSVIVGEVLTPESGNRKTVTSQMWVFDPQPKLIEVPRLKPSKKSKKFS